ncbi:MAG: penicillin-binding transpeptidase domain-containing protein [Planctomycetota bacterium]|jgi:penicillin-binding protein 2|nr:penicillin-binding transpeptidase domain-containing protein [Planctomycetota bacterium]MDA1024949.1 penicillin-binding transpeptidase domain-containing protein [Planctomycetota bacterium]
MRPPSGQTDARITPFHIRLVVLVLVFAIIAVALAAQMTRLAIIEGPARLARAEARLIQRSYQPTIRGPIVDRVGRPLAVERSSWDFSVDYEVLTGEWQRRQAYRQARRTIGTDWSSLSRSDREAAIEEAIPEWNRRVREVWTAAERHAGLDLSTLPSRLDDIRRGVSGRAASVWQRQFEALAKRRGRSEAEEIFIERPIAEQKGLHSIVENFADSDEDTFLLQKAIAALDAAVLETGGSPESEAAFAVVDVNRRIRGYAEAGVPIDRSTLPANLRGPGIAEISVGGVASTLVGTTRSDVTREDLDRRPFLDKDSNSIDYRGYRPGRDIVGSTGLEREFDDRLHGAIGMREIDRSSGAVLAEVIAEPGRGRRLAIDVALQARVRAVMKPDLGLMKVQQYHYGWNAAGPRATTLPLGTPLNGAAVVVDIRTGETLALVSTPTFADVEPSRRDIELMLMPDSDVESLSESDGLRRRELQDLAPFRNRAIATAYAPGSIVKPLIYIAGVESGRFGLQQSIECKGWIRGEFLRPRCWGWRPEAGLYGRHETLGPVDAIAQSCNIYFYTIADTLGPKAMHDWYRILGLEAEHGPGLANASSGTFIPDDTAIGRMLFGIGQGSVAWTPLHAATAYARLANQGGEVVPVLVLEEEPAAEVEPGDWSREAVRIAFQGMRKSAKEGTASQLWLENRRREDILDFSDLGDAAPIVWAKTGTAQVTGKASHAWYAGMVAPAGEQQPRYAFAVVVEHGNSGGRAGGAIAAQLIRALAAEGYLGEAALDRINPEVRHIDWLDAIPIKDGIVDPAAFFLQGDVAIEPASRRGGEDG